MKILVVDDDARLREVVSIAMERAGFSVITAADGQMALTHAARELPDLIVLDVGLPERDGFDVCRKIRERSDVPILFLTARDDEIDRVVGLELGADDYVTKPFSPRELVARVNAILKRVAAAPVRTLSHDDLTLNEAAHQCHFGKHPVPLTSTEQVILANLMRDPARVVSRRQMVDAIWGRGSDVSGRTLDSHLRNLRRKLADAGCVDAIVTAHGVGMRMGRCRVE